MPSEGETENKLKDTKKDYEEPVFETATENEEKTEKDGQKFFETEQKINKTDSEATKDKVIKGIVETIDSAVKGEEPLKQDNKIYLFVTMIIYLIMMKLLQKIKKLSWILLIKLILIAINKFVTVMRTEQSKLLMKIRRSKKE